MRLSTLLKLLAVGGGAALLVGNRRKREAVDGAPDEIPAGIATEPDPNDPVQSLDEVQQFHVEELGVDVQDNGAIPVALDDELPDNDRSFEQGQNWLEALETRTAEDGPEPEHAIEIDDDHDHERAWGSRR
jgi:hypothetical protein